MINEKKGIVENAIRVINRCFGINDTRLISEDPKIGATLMLQGKKCFLSAQMAMDITKPGGTYTAEEFCHRTLNGDKYIG